MMDDFVSSDVEEAEEETTGSVGVVDAAGVVNVAVAAVNSDQPAPPSLRQVLILLLSLRSHYNTH